MNKESTTKIPLIFATDDGYVPFLSVALKSIIENANKDYFYPVYILTAGLSSENISKLKELENENFSIETVDVTKNLNELKSSLHLRDYYSKAIYYRIFIPTLFRQYEKAIYLDCDIVVTDDISKMYFVDLKDNLLGAITEEVMINVDVFGRYSEEALGVEIDEEKNKIKGELMEISTPNSKIKVLVVPTNEELMIARDVMRIAKIK